MKSFILASDKDKEAMKEKAKQIESEKRFNLQFIPLVKILPNKLNKVYEVSGIPELARSIKDIGLQHNLTVIAQNDGKYRIVSGERRYRAIKLILEEDPDNEMFKGGIPCKVIRQEDEVMEEIMLLRSNNDVRSVDGATRRNVCLKLLELYKIRKDRGDIKGSLYNQLADDLQISARQIAKYAATGKLIPELEKMVESGKLKIDDAEKYCVLDEEGQKAIANLYQSNGEVSKAELTEIKRLKTEKDKIVEQTSQEIETLTKEKEELRLKIEEFEKKTEEIQKNMDTPSATNNVEELIREKLDTETKLKNLQRQRDDLRDRVDELTKQLKKPIEIDATRLKQIKIEVQLEESLTKMENSFDTIRKESRTIYENSELFNRLSILSDRITRIVQQK